METKHADTLLAVRQAQQARAGENPSQERSVSDSPPVRVNKSGRFARVHAVQLKRAFLEAYSKYGNIGHCADLVGIGRNLIYTWQEQDQEFSLAFQQAEKRAIETLEHEAWRRAVEGSPYTRTSYYRGEPVGTDHKIEYSDQLLTLLLRAKVPERYRDRVDVNVSQVVKTIAGVDPASVL